MLTRCRTGKGSSLIAVRIGREWVGALQALLGGACGRRSDAGGLVVALSRRGVSATGGDLNVWQVAVTQSNGDFTDVFVLLLGAMKAEIVAFRSLVGCIVQIFGRRSCILEPCVSRLR